MLIPFIAAMSAPIAQSQQVPPVVFRTVNASLMAHTCALTDTGRAYCWGLNATGQLGSDSATDECTHEHERLACSKRPVSVNGDLAFVSLITGSFHTCGLTEDGHAYCWGLNESGQLGTDSAADLCRSWGETLPCSKKPVPVAGGLIFASLTAGGFHTCGITREHAAYCWGNNQGSQLGADSGAHKCRHESAGELAFHPCSRVPVALPGDLDLAAISAGDAYTCGISTDSLLYCWGYREGMAGPSLVARAQASDSLRLTSVSVGVSKVCGVDLTGALYCWGAWNETCCWRSVLERPRSPGASSRKKGTSAAWYGSAVTTGGEHACILRAGGEAYCWGDGRQGQLGTGSRDFANEPVRISGNSLYVSLSAGQAHTCGVTRAGAVLCWGAGAVGELGNGETGTKRKPEPVINPASRRRS